jgi:hypothetical protein
MLLRHSDHTRYAPQRGYAHSAPHSRERLPSHYHASGMPSSRHKATLRGGIGEICELLCESLYVLGISANARCLRNVACREANITLGQATHNSKQALPPERRDAHHVVIAIRVLRIPARRMCAARQNVGELFRAKGAIDRIGATCSASSMIRARRRYPSWL